MKILVIEDDELVRQYLVELLERQGYDVVAACDGQEGVEACRDSGTHLVITDIIMPEKDGIEAILELRRDNPGIKVIAISGGGRGQPEDYLNSARLLGADLALAKPFTNQDLLSAIRTLMKQEQASD